MWRETIQGKTVAEIAKISIHSLRVEGDRGVNFARNRPKIFQSTPSVWRETLAAVGSRALVAISIHSLRVEGDSTDSGTVSPPLLISIHSLRVEGDRAPAITKNYSHDFNPLPPCGGRQRLKSQEVI